MSTKAITRVVVQTGDDTVHYLDARSVLELEKLADIGDVKPVEVLADLIHLRAADLQLSIAARVHRGRRSCMAASGHAWRDLEQGGRCDCAHCVGECDC